MTYRKVPAHAAAFPNRKRVVELFAGVGGFRIGLERAGWNVVWSNQWEPTTKRQHASDVYIARFGAQGHSNENITEILDRCEQDWTAFPDHDLLVGGFPCQDYSVARTLNQAAGLRGKKGVLWWEIHRILENKKPPFVLLENVDRLLSSPASQRGRDFAVMLSCLAELGYVVEWRVVNAADYGFPQRRRRVYIFAAHMGHLGPVADPVNWLAAEGILAQALPVQPVEQGVMPFPITIGPNVGEISEQFGAGALRSPFRSAGVLLGRNAWTVDLNPLFDGRKQALQDVLQHADQVPESFYISTERIPQWAYLKGAKKEGRVHQKTGAQYFYTEGAIPFPDPIDRPARTILTGEGGTSPSRFKHVIRTKDGRLRRLTPLELERLNGFPDDWTNIPGVPDGRRAFLMGNALVVGLVKRIGSAMHALSPEHELVSNVRAGAGS
jgi:DNA (cytosine-5)-methyltransferase 1